MRATLKQFLQNLAILDDRIDLRKNHSDVVKRILDYSGNHLREAQEYANKVDSARRQRVIEYNSVIITLYGFFENYVEDLVSDYSERAVLICGGIGSAPKKIRENHISTTIESILREQEYGGIDQSVIESRIHNLSKCIDVSSSTSINSDSFSFHTSNVKPSVVDDLFSRVGINNISKRAARTDHYEEFLSSEYSVSEADERVLEESLRKVKKLSRRRNDVAHGNYSFSMSPSLLKEYLRHIQEFGKSLFVVSSRSCLPLLLDEHSSYLGDPIEVYNNEIVCVRSNNCSISERDGIILDTGNSTTPYRLGRIESIEIQGENISHVPPCVDVKIGMRIDAKAKGNYSVYHISQSHADPLFYNDLI